MSDDRPAECEAFAAAMNAVLDGDAPATALASAHTVVCRDCRELAAAARLLAAAGPALQVPLAVPTDLHPRLVRSAMRARRRRRLVPMLAACLAVAGGVWLTRPPAESGRVAAGRGEPSTPTTNSLRIRPTAPVGRVADQWAAVASVARSASEKAAAPARSLTARGTTTSSHGDGSPPDPLAGLERASQVTAEPVAGTARRAVGLFLRDFGLSAKPAG